MSLADFELSGHGERDQDFEQQKLEPVCIENLRHLKSEFFTDDQLATGGVVCTTAMRPLMRLIAVTALDDGHSHNPTC
jgi:hypothetical protein